MRSAKALAAGIVAALALAGVAGAATWTTPQVFANGPYYYNPAVAQGPDGTAYAAFSQYYLSCHCYYLRVANRTPSGAIGFTTLGSSAPATAPSVFAGGDGTVGVAWEHNEGSLADVAVRFKRPGQPWTGAALLSGTNLSSNHGIGDYPQVAIDDQGTLYVAWETYNLSNGVYYFWVQAAFRRKTDTMWHGPYTLSAAQVNAHAVRVAADGNGYALFSWMQDVNGGGEQVYANPKVPNSVIVTGNPQLLSTKTYVVAPPSPGVSAGGKNAVVWEQQVTNTDHRILGKTAPVNTPFPASAPYMSSPVGEFNAAAVASNGNGVAAWQETATGGWKVQADNLPAGSFAWNGLTTLTPPGYNSVAAGPPGVAINHQRAIVGWQQVQSGTSNYSVGIRVRPFGYPFQTTTYFPGNASVRVAVPNDPLATTQLQGVALFKPAGGGLDFSVLH